MLQIAPNFAEQLMLAAISGFKHKSMRFFNVVLDDRTKTETTPFNSDFSCEDFPMHSQQSHVQNIYRTYF